MAKAPWNNALEFIVIRATDHGMSFAAASLSISKYCAIIAFDDMFDEGVGGLGVDFCLFWGLAKDSIVGKALDVIVFVGVGEVDLIIILVYLRDGLAAAL